VIARRRAGALAGRARAAIVLAAIAAAIVPLPSAFVDRVYARSIYASLQPVLTGLSNRTPVALFDVLAIGAPLLWVVFTLRDAGRRVGWRRGAGLAAVRLVVGASIAYLAFVSLWAFNYRRTPLTTTLQFERAAVTPDAARALAATTIARLNALHRAAHDAGWQGASAIDPTLARAVDAVAHAVGGTGLSVPARPKHTAFDWYFRRAGVSGMTDPFFLETIVESDLLPFERPFVVAHEWAHLAGFPNEGEANFVGWLACVRSDVAHQYSGWLSLYAEVMASVGQSDRVDLARGLGPGPRADLAAIRGRLMRELSPRVSDASRQAYDRYLKANRVNAGMNSYGEVVRLILGTRFGAEAAAR
jgi:hypothetical protein